VVIEFVSLDGAFQALAAAEDDPEEASNKLARVLARSDDEGAMRSSRGS
jgi:hypothetical protein